MYFEKIWLILLNQTSLIHRRVWITFVIQPIKNYFMDDEKKDLLITINRQQRKKKNGSQLLPTYHQWSCRLATAGRKHSWQSVQLVTLPNSPTNMQSGTTDIFTLLIKLTWSSWVLSILSLGINNIFILSYYLSLHAILLVSSNIYFYSK